MVGWLFWVKWPFETVPQSISDSLTEREKEKRKERRKKMPKQPPCLSNTNAIALALLLSNLVGRTGPASTRRRPPPYITGSFEISVFDITRVICNNLKGQLHFYYFSPMSSTRNKEIYCNIFSLVLAYDQKTFILIYLDNFQKMNAFNGKTYY